MALPPPTWALDLPRHIQLTPYQVERLELIREHAGASHSEFHLHVKSHPECTKMLQRHMYHQIRNTDPGQPEELYLIAIIAQRYQTARLTGGDLFAFTRILPPAAAPDGPEVVAAALAIIQDRGLSTIDEVAQAIVEDEASLPAVSPSPGTEELLRQVTLILSERTAAPPA